MRILSIVLVPLALVLTPGEGRSVQETADRSREPVTLDFQDADIRQVVAALAELTGVNVAYGALPQRTVTLKTNTPVPRDSLRAIFESLLEANGLQATEEAGVVRVATVGEPDRSVERAAAPGESRLFVVRLKHAHASEVASVLNALFGSGPTSLGERPSLGGRRLSERLREGLVPPALPGAPGERAPAPTPPPVAGEAPSRGLHGEIRGEVTIVPDLATNSLFIRATPEDFDVVSQAIGELDVRPLQVMIEVLIAEVRRDALTRLGLQVLVPDQTVDGTSIGGELNESVDGNLIVQIMQLEGARVEALFDALSTSSDVNILSRPVLVTENNQEGHILVGSERPFIQVSRSLPTDEAVRDQVIQFRDVGTKLSVIPTINYDGYVRLSVLQEVSQATAETQFGAPVISTREAATQLLVKDGQTVVIGGLVDQQREQIRSGVPILKDIPILGVLFRSSSWRTVETELFLFLTPHVLANDEDSERVREAVGQVVPEIRKALPGALPLPDSASADTANASKP